MNAKRFLLLAVFAVIAVPLAYSQNERFTAILKFSGGLNSQASPYIIPDDKASTAQNVRFNEVYGGIAKRQINLLYGTIGAYPVEALHRYYKSDDTKRLVAAGSTKLFVGNDSTGAFQTIGTGYSEGKRWQFVTYKDVAVGMNGYENAIKYDGKIEVTANTDGARTAENLVAELGAPFAELQTGTSLDAEAWYMYKVVFYDGTNYWYSTARSNAILTGSTIHNITLTDVPLGPTGTTKRYVYRTLGASTKDDVLADTTYYLVKELADNTTTTFEDNISDSSADDGAAPTWATATSGGLNVTPPKGKFCAIHEERLFISGNITYLSDVYFSDTYNPDFFYPEYYVQIRPDDGDRITFLKTQLGILTVGKTNTIQKLYTNNTDVTQWSVSNPMSFIGCPAPYSAANTPQGIYYLSRNGIYRFNGQYSQLISDAVTPQISDILQSNIDKATGFYYKNEYHLSYTSQESGGTLNNRVLVYDLVRDAYSVDIKSIDAFVAFDASTDFGVLYHGSSASDGKVYADTESSSLVIKRYKDDFTEGTFDDTRAAGTINSKGISSPTSTEFWIELAHDGTIDEESGDIDDAVGIIDRPDTDGTWTSPVYRIDASSMTQIQWNEDLGNYGDITFAVRACDDSACSGEAWSSEMTNPNGSDLTALTANTYIQVRATLSTTDIDYSPELIVSDGYLFRIFYKKNGANQEPSVFSVWKSGWKGFDNSGYKKFLRRMRVLYTGSAGTLKVRYENNEGDVSRSFDVDMSVAPTDSATDLYTGKENYKIFEHYPSENTSTDPAPTGELWRFGVEHTGNDDWKILGIEIEYEYEPLY